MMLLKCYSQYVSKTGKLTSGHKIGKLSFHFYLKEGQCQRMFKLLYNCAHFTCLQSYAQNPASQVSAVHEPRTSRCTSWIQKSRGNRSNCQHLLNYGKARGFQKNFFSSSLLTMLKPLTVWITTNCGKFLKNGNTRPPYLSPAKPV